MYGPVALDSSSWTPVTPGCLLTERETFMNPEEQQLNPRHQPETVSTAIQQSFEDPEGGLPLDSPLVRIREQESRGRPTSIDQPPSGADGKTAC